MTGFRVNHGMTKRVNTAFPEFVSRGMYREPGGRTSLDWRAE